MTIIQHAPSEAEILDFVDDSIRQLRETGNVAQFILVGPTSYERLAAAVADRFRRSAGLFETYGHLPIVVDPLRGDQVVVLPAASSAAAEATVVSTS